MEEKSKELKEEEYQDSTEEGKYETIIKWMKEAAEIASGRKEREKMEEEEKEKKTIRKGTRKKNPVECRVGCRVRGSD